MIVFVLVVILFLASLLILFRAPTSHLWYVAILVTEFCWIFILLLILLLFLPAGSFEWPKRTVAAVGLLIFSLPVIQAFRLSKSILKSMPVSFGVANPAPGAFPFHPLKMITGIAAKKTGYNTFWYDEANQLSLHFYPSIKAGLRPCIIVIHGGSWAGGNNLQLPELNSVLTRQGYHVASIHYRLAPSHCFPSPVQDVQTALNFLSSKAAALHIDTTAFTLLGRSAGGQIALSAAYTLHDQRIKGVIAFYAPADMVWGYQIRCSPLVLDSRKVMRDYLGGTPQQMQHQYEGSSPVHTVTHNAPPGLLLYAEHDPLVSPRHGNRLTKRLNQLGVPHYAVYFPWATHGFDYTLNGPGGQLSTWTVLQFLSIVHPMQIAT